MYVLLLVGEAVYSNFFSQSTLSPLLGSTWIDDQDAAVKMRTEKYRKLAKDPCMALWRELAVGRDLFLCVAPTPSVHMSGPGSNCPVHLVGGRSSAQEKSQTRRRRFLPDPLKPTAPI